MAKRVSDSKSRHKGLAFIEKINTLSIRIVLPTVLVILLLGLVLYLFVLSHVSNFSNQIIIENLEWMSHDLYGICDKSYDTILQSGPNEYNKINIIQKGKTIGKIEDFCNKNNTYIIILEKNRPPLLDTFPSQFIQDLNLNEFTTENSVINITINNQKFFAYNFQYEPWHWKLLLFKNKNIYENMITRVRNTYLITALLLFIIIVFLIIIFNQVLKKPMNYIITSLGQHTIPHYHGIKEFQYISDQIRRLMNTMHQKSDWINKLISSVGALIIVLNTEGKIIMINKTTELLTGYNNDNEKGKYIWESFLPSRFKKLIQSFLININKQNFPINYEGFIYDIHHQKRNIYWNTTLIDDQNKEDKLLITTGIDITEKKMTEKKLYEEELKYKMLVESMNEGFIILNNEGILTYVNKNICKMLEYTNDEMIGRPIYDFFNASNKEIIRNELEKRKNKINDLYEITWETKNKNQITTLISPMYIFNKKGQFMGSFGVVSDITTRKKLEEELIKAHKLESIGILAGGLAHDFNNILTGIIGHLTIAKIKSMENNEVHEILSEAERVAFGAKDLTHQLLTFSKGGSPIIKVDSIINTVKKSAQFSLRGSNIKCNFLFPDDLWLAKYDKGQISQVINNVVINAKQAMPEGGTIDIECENVVFELNEFPIKRGKYIRIHIKDFGCGIEDDIINKIFDPYFTTKSNGSGLGLASSYSIMKRHNGYIFAESELNKGTTISLYLPAIDKQEIPQAKKIDNNLNKHGYILIMDDEDMILKTTSLMLQHLGYKTETAIEGKDAIKKYQDAMINKTPFDIIITDLTIPGGMGGEKTIEELLKIDPDVKAIVSSGYSNNDVMANYDRYGFKGVIVKPYTMETLSTVITKVLNSE